MRKSALLKMYLSMVNPSFRNEYCSVYEIYPQMETPHLTKIAHLDFLNTSSAHLLLPGKVIWFDFYETKIVFRVWHYQLNHSICFSFVIDFDKFEVYFILFKALKLTSKIIGWCR